jgi:hypothetical protein
MLGQYEEITGKEEKKNTIAFSKSPCAHNKRVFKRMLKFNPHPA